jgi:ribosomal protein S18 acetylase RimI-like enzyme
MRAEHQGPLRWSADATEALALADRSPLRIPHLADWPYRFASWALDDPQNTQVWRDASGRLLGWAVLQTPFWALDVVVHPAAPADRYATMLTWATTRATTLAAQGAGRPLWFVSIDAACHAERAHLERHGFVDVSDAAVDPWSKRLMVINPDREPVAPELPAGFQVRSLNVHTEIDAYVDLHREVFQSASMTVDWRRRATHMADYHNDLDLVLIAPNGTVCGFCIAWVRRREAGEVVGQIEPLGIQQPYRGRQLSRVLIAEAVRRSRALGAGRVFVETDQPNPAALAAYHAMGFRIAHTVRVYRYQVPSSQE